MATQWNWIVMLSEISLSAERQVPHDFICGVKKRLTLYELKVEW